jgi:hypothetical protein
VYIGIEARQLFIECAGKLQEPNNRAIESLTRNQQGNTRWIWREQHGRHSTFEFIDGYSIHFAVRQMLEGNRWFHHRFHVATNTFRL